MEHVSPRASSQVVERHALVFLGSGNVLRDAIVNTLSIGRLFSLHLL